MKKTYEKPTKNEHRMWDMNEWMNGRWKQRSEKLTIFCSVCKRLSIFQWWTMREQEAERKEIYTWRRRASAVDETWRINHIEVSVTFSILFLFRFPSFHNHHSTNPPTLAINHHLRLVSVRQWLQCSFFRPHSTHTRREIIVSKTINHPQSAPKARKDEPMYELIIAWIRRWKKIVV